MPKKYTKEGRVLVFGAGVLRVQSVVIGKAGRKKCERLPRGVCNQEAERDGCLIASVRQAASCVGVCICACTRQKGGGRGRGRGRREGGGRRRKERERERERERCQCQVLYLLPSTLSFEAGRVSCKTRHSLIDWSVSSEDLLASVLTSIHLEFPCA